MEGEGKVTMKDEGLRIYCGGDEGAPTKKDGGKKRKRGSLREGGGREERERRGGQRWLGRKAKGLLKDNKNQIEKGTGKESRHG